METKTGSGKGKKMRGGLAVGKSHGRLNTYRGSVDAGAEKPRKLKGQEAFLLFAMGTSSLLLMNHSPYILGLSKNSRITRRYTALVLRLKNRGQGLEDFVQ